MLLQTRRRKLHLVLLLITFRETLMRFPRFKEKMMISHSPNSDTSRVARSTLRTTSIGSDCLSDPWSQSSSSQTLVNIIQAARSKTSPHLVSLSNLQSSSLSRREIWSWTISPAESQAQLITRILRESPSKSLSYSILPRSIFKIPMKWVWLINQLPLFFYFGL